MSTRDRTVFVTVGTTEFPELISAISGPAVLTTLAHHGFRRLIIQHGKGPAPVISEEHQPLQMEWFSLRPGIQDYLKRADLVISHGGAGTILETLYLGKELLVVINDRLLHNHQQEMAQKLQDQRHLIYTTVDGLLETLESLDFSGRRPFEKPSCAAMMDDLETLMGMTSED